MSDQINVTKSLLPPLETVTQLLSEVWERGVLTNNGPLIQRLEEEIAQFLSVPDVVIVSNGTVALQLLYQALGLRGTEIITTPFSYVATVSSMIWEYCTPVFVDVDADTFNLDPDLVEQAITPETKAIVGVHVYGLPCDDARLGAIADEHELKVLYDAAHGFGVKVDGESVFKLGLASTASFHATKLFHMVEGGAIITEDPELSARVRSMRQFGHRGSYSFDGVGINAKNSEVHAAVGLAVLPYVQKSIENRRAAARVYGEVLADSPVVVTQVPASVDHNYAYYPILLQHTEQMHRVIGHLERHSINVRRYFYPALNKLDYVTGQACPVAEDLASRVICLPMSAELSAAQAEMIAEKVVEAL